MNLFREQLLAALSGQGVPVAKAMWVAPDEISGDVFATVSRDWVAATGDAFVDTLAKNTPRLVEVRPDPAGGIGKQVPKYILNGFCCRGHALAAYAHGMMGFALKAANSVAPLDHDALAFGFLHYTAIPRPENGHRNGRHELLWGLDHDGKFFTYEIGDRSFEPLTPDELASVTLVFAQ